MEPSVQCTPDVSATPKRDGANSSSSDKQVSLLAESGQTLEGVSNAALS